jgi:hypothetical protein
MTVPSPTRISTFLCLTVGMLMLTGCGGAHDATVHGVAKLDGKPLEYGNVQFHAVGGGATAYGTFSAGGVYELSTGAEKSLAPGKYKVTVVATEAPPANLPVGQAPPIGKLLTAPKYGTIEQTPLEFDVVAGDNTIDLPLTSQ